MQDIAPTPPEQPHKQVAGVRPLIDKLCTKKGLVAIVIAVLAIAVIVAVAMHSNGPKPQPASNSSQNSQTHPKQAPQLSITTPADNSETLDSAIAVTGTVTTGAMVTVNGISAPVNKGSFTTVVTLTVGSNTITIAATSKDGEKTSSTLTVTRNQPAAATPSITLTGSTRGDASGSGGKATISLSWERNGTEVKKSYYILRSASPQPTYTGTAYGTDQDGNRSFADSVPLDGTIYYYRVCEIVAGKCGTYSNQLPVAAQIASSGETITITGTNGATVNWNASGVLGNGGFLLLWSPDPNPSFPSAGTVYSKAQTNVINFTATMDHDFVSGSTYYVRVCENLGGKCGSYSDQVTVTAP
ncbi:MAG TPA: hypothetical protein VLH86_03245 [Patescibacteria group bacterium]|nr:hypothetical protein [Patescibacteria group bacterium]